MNSIQYDQDVQDFIEIVKCFSKMNNFLDDKNNECIQWEHPLVTLQDCIINKFVQKIKDKYNIREDIIYEYAYNVLDTAE